MKLPRICWGLGNGHAVVGSNNDARVMEEDIIRFCRKRTAHFKAPKALHSYLHYLKVLKASS
jgi:hypothetical protein